MFEDITIGLLWFATTWLVANIIIGLVEGLRVGTLILENKLKQRLDHIIHRVRVEKFGDVFYWYDMDDQEFLAQGTSDEEIISTLKSRYPDHIFFLATNHVISKKTDWKATPGPFKFTVVDQNLPK